MIPIAEPSLGEEELNNVVEAVRSGWISSKGKFILEFERGFADYCGVRHGIATANGTVALHLALTALEIGPGDEVIVPTLTFIATANAVRYTGAKPVFVDSLFAHWCIDPQRIEEAITPKTKAIIPVHLYGHPCDMEPILDIARRHNLHVVEDAAEAHGAEYKGKKVGSFGHVSCFSFYGNKMITTGEGGICLTDDEKLADRMRILRDHGMNPSRRYWHDTVGFNYRMTNIQAAIGVAQLKKLDGFVRRKREIAHTYDSLLEGISGITLPPEAPWAKNVYWMYCVLMGDEIATSRDQFSERLARVGVETRPFFYPVHSMPPYDEGQCFPVAEELSQIGLNLPSFPNLDRQGIMCIVDTMKAELSTMSHIVV